nr:MAG TPA: hypothetical protein [Caudoviricetes sp.]
MKLKKKDYELIHSIDFVHRKSNIKDLETAIEVFTNVDQFVRPFQPGAHIRVNLVTGDQYHLTFCKDKWNDENINCLEDRLARYLRNYSYSTITELTMLDRTGNIFAELQDLNTFIQIRNNQGKVKVLNRSNIKKKLTKLLSSEFDFVGTIQLISTLYETGTRKESRLEIEFNYPEDLYESSEEVIEYFLQDVENHEYLYHRGE